MQHMLYFVYIILICLFYSQCNENELNIQNVSKQLKL